MDLIFIATAGGIGALILWGVSDWLTSRSSKGFTGAEANFSIQLTSGLSMLIIWLLSKESLPSLTDTLILILTAGFFTVAYICFIKAFSIGKTGVVAPLANTYPLVTLLLAFAFLTVSFSTLQFLAILMISSAAILLGIEKFEDILSQFKNRPSKEVLYALLTALFWGTGFFTVGFVTDLAWEAVVGVMSIAMACFATLIFMFQTKGKIGANFSKVISNKAGLASGAMLTLGSVAFYASVEVTENIIIPTVIAAASALVTSILAAIFDGEKLAITKRAGAVLVVIGLIFLNL